MKQNRLANISRRQQGKRGVPDLYDSAIMLMKTHIENMSETGLAIMFMKTQGLISFCHYVDDNKAGYRNRFLDFCACEEKAKGRDACFRLAGPEVAATLCRQDDAILPRRNRAGYFANLSIRTLGIDNSFGRR